MSRIADLVAARQRIAFLEDRLSNRTTQLILALDETATLKAQYGNQSTNPTR